ncbi:MAG: GNAT family N-acetyltransferase [Burkholderiales bacterium]|nr:GNAT family N-acetyltransferase [Burkholderiales bacterium]
MNLDLALLERWLTGWSLGRGLPLPTRCYGGLTVEVGRPEQLRRHVFVEAGADLQCCAAQIDEAFVFVKAAVQPEALRAALPIRWQIEPLHFVMTQGERRGSASLPLDYQIDLDVENAGHVASVRDANGELAAIGRAAIHDGSAVFDRIETMEAHRRKGLGSVIMYTLDRLACDLGAHERLLVAADAGRALYETLGWRVVAPMSTAVLAKA